MGTFDRIWRRLCHCTGWKAVYMEPAATSEDTENTTLCFESYGRDPQFRGDIRRFLFENPDGCWLWIHESGRYSHEVATYGYFVDNTRMIPVRDRSFMALSTQEHHVLEGYTQLFPGLDELELLSPSSEGSQ